MFVWLLGRIVVWRGSIRMVGQLYTCLSRTNMHLLQMPHILWHSEVLLAMFRVSYNTCGVVSACAFAQHHQASNVLSVVRCQGGCHDMYLQLALTKPSPSDCPCVTCVCLVQAFGQWQVSWWALAWCRAGP